MGGGTKRRTGVRLGVGWRCEGEGRARSPWDGEAARSGLILYRRAAPRDRTKDGTEGQGVGWGWGSLRSRFTSGERTEGTWNGVNEESE